MDSPEERGAWEDTRRWLYYVSRRVGGPEDCREDSSGIASLSHVRISPSAAGKICGRVTVMISISRPGRRYDLRARAALARLIRSRPQRADEEHLRS